MNNPLMRQVESLKELVHQQMERAFKNANEVMSFTEISDVRKIYIAGLGDSYACAMALVNFLKKYSDTYEVEVMTPMYFTRFAKNNAFDKGEPNSPLMIVISNGGESSRIVETVKKANEMGMVTMAITNNLDSRSAKLANKTLWMELEKVDYATVGLRSYVAMLLALFAFIVRFGKVRGTISPLLEESLKTDILNLFDAYVENYDTFKTTAAQIAQVIKDNDVIDFIGDGTSYASAYFSSAKFVECLGSLISIDDSENWCHINAYIKSENHVPTFIFSNRNSINYSRQIETARQAVLMNRNVIVVGDVDENDFMEEATILLLPPQKCHHWIQLFFEYIPISMIVANLQEINQTRDFCSDIQSKNATTKSSKIEVYL